MNAEKTKKQVEWAIEKLAEELERGKSDTLKAYLAAMGRFTRYSLGNSMLIAMARPDATHVAGFHAWRKLGRSVRKGERGIAIMAPIVRRNRKAGEGPNDRNVERGREEERESVIAFRTTFVFDIKQTQGKELPAFARVRGEPGEWMERLYALIRERGIAVRFEDDLGGAEGRSMGGTILIRRGLADAESFSILVHEYAHENLHKDSVERSKTLKEVEAEAVAFAVCAAVGLESIGSSCDYIHLYDGKKETLMASLERIRLLAREIIEAIQPKDEGVATPITDVASEVIEARQAA